eukprot:GHUV01048049.1.p1 GENE.GHUV01048049.1~~GHUV01048049.1.p1  ORF type:complete len:132 (+),score=8.43 GHUV01048049.1:78-473(+)
MYTLIVICTCSSGTSFKNTSGRRSSPQNASSGTVSSARSDCLPIHVTAARHFFGLPGRRTYSVTALATWETRQMYNRSMPATAQNDRQQPSLTRTRLLVPASPRSNQLPSCCCHCWCLHMCFGDDAVFVCV